MAKKITFALLALTLVSMLSGEGFLGVYLDDMDKDDFEGAGIEEPYGVRITGTIEKSPAEMAGLARGDIIRKINGEKIFTDDQISRMFDGMNPGDRVEIEILREKERMTFKTEMGDVKDVLPQKTYLGVMLRNLSSEKLKEMGVEGGYGIQISNVIEGEAAHKAGLQDDDIILEIDGSKVYTIDQGQKMIALQKPGDVVSITIWRDGNRETYNVELGSKTDVGAVFSHGFNWVDDLPSSYSIFHNVRQRDKMIGVTLSEVNKKGFQGVYIESVMDESPAKKAGLMKGDYVISIDDDKVSTIREIEEHIDKTDIGGTIEILVKRYEEEITCTVEVVKGEDIPGAMRSVNVFSEDGEIKIMMEGLDEAMSTVREQLKGMKVMQGMRNIDIEEEDGKMIIRIESDEDEDDVDEVILDINATAPAAGAI